MREIKFRAWDATNKKMYSVVDLYFDAPGSEIPPSVGVPGKLFKDFETGERDYDVQYIPEKDCILMQFTGLKDKNGKEIFEGDIVEGKIDPESGYVARGRIEFQEKGDLYGLYVADGLDDGKTYYGSWDIRQFCYGVDEYNPKVEIIGNIYENPELLKEEREK